MLYINLKKLTKCSLSSRAYVKKAIEVDYLLRGFILPKTKNIYYLR